MTPDSEAEHDCTVPAGDDCRAGDCTRPVNPDFHGLCDTHWVTRADLRKE